MYSTTVYVHTKSTVNVRDVMYTAAATPLVSLRPLTFTRRVAKARKRARICKEEDERKEEEEGEEEGEEGGGGGGGGARGGGGGGRGEG